MECENMNTQQLDFFNGLIDAFHHIWDNKEDIQDFILALSNRIEEDDDEVDEDYKPNIIDEILTKRDIKDDERMNDAVDEDLEVHTSDDGFLSLK
jgi:hypothetical protein